MDFSERLKKWMDDNKVKQIDLVNKCNVTKGFVSRVVNGSQPPSKNFLEGLTSISGKDTNWWLFGKEEYDNLDSLNMLINTLISTGQIKEDGAYDNDIELILKTMLDKEIRVKLKKKKEQHI